MLNTPINFFIRFLKFSWVKPVQSMRMNCLVQGHNTAPLVRFGPATCWYCTHCHTVLNNTLMVLLRKWLDIIDKHIMTMVNVLSNTSCLSKRHIQTVHTQIRLLLKRQSDKGITCLLFRFVSILRPPALISSILFAERKRKQLRIFKTLTQ